MTNTGRIVEVSVVPFGDVLLADHALNATVLTMNSAVDFDEGGGTLSFEHPTTPDTTVVLAYSSADIEAGTITLPAPGLTVAAPSDTFIAPHPPSDEKVAQVILDDEDDALSCRIPHGLYDRLAEGVRDPDAQEAVEVDIDSGGEWYVVDILGVVPSIDGTYIDGDTLPPPPILPPEAPVTPVLTVTGMARGLMVEVENGKPGWSYVYTITDHTDENSANIVQQYPATSRPTLYLVEMPDGTPLKPPTSSGPTPVATSTGYSFTVTATNESGSATSAASPVTPLVLNDSNTISELRIDLLRSGEMRAALALLGSIEVGDNITITPEGGIVVHTPLGDTILPANGERPTFTGEATFAALTALGNLKIQGVTNEVAKGSTLELATGTTAPKTSPALSSYWPTKTIHEGFNNRGLAWHAATSRHYRAESAAGAAVTATTEDADSLDITFGGQVSVDGADPGAGGWNRGEVTSGLGGVVIISNTMYVLCQTDEAVPGTFFGRWYVYRGTWNATTQKWDYVGRWLWEPADYLGGNSTFRPALGVSGTNLLIAQCGAGGQAWLTELTPSTGAVITRDRLRNADGTVWSPSKDFHYVERGTFDLGVNRVVAGIESNLTAYVFDPASATDTFKRDTSREFPWPSAAGNVLGARWDGSKWRSTSAKNIYDHTSITSATLSAVQTWRKADGVSPDFAQYETDKSAASITTTFPKRSALLLTSGPIPDDITDPNDPDAVSFYVAQNDTSGSNTSFKRQAVPAAGVTSKGYTSLDTLGGNPPTAPNFPAATPARIVSDAADSAPLVDLRGTGQWRLGDISGDTAGRVVGGAFVPIGGAIPFFGAVAPTGWLLCNGGTFTEGAYPLLAAFALANGWQVTGTAPNRTFTLPDTSDRFISGAGAVRPAGSSGGADTVTMPEHQHHPGTLGTAEGASVTRAQGTTANASPANHTHTITGQTGNVVGTNPPISNVPKFISANYIIRAA